MIDKITSVFDNYSGKIKNPFIGTIISVWLIHNWRIPFALFNFDKECTMIDKINFIADYFGKQNFWFELFSIIGISLLILVITFILLAISRALTEIYYKVVESNIITKIDEKAIYTKEEKERLEARILNLNSKIETRDNEILRLEGANSKISIEKEKEIESLNALLLKEKENYEGIKTSFIPFSSARSEFEKYFDKVSKETLRKLFTTDEVLKKIYIQNENDIDFLKSNGIIYIEKQNVKTMDIAIMNQINKKNQDYILTKYGMLFVKFLKHTDKFI